MEVKALVNDGLNPAITRLTEIQSELPEWERKAIDKMLGSALALAKDANSAILNLNESGTKPIHMNEEYRAFLDSVDEHAENLVRTADAAGEYVDAHRQAVEAGLEVPTHR